MIGARSTITRSQIKKKQLFITLLGQKLGSFAVLANMMVVWNILPVVAIIPGRIHITFSVCHVTVGACQQICKRLKNKSIANNALFSSRKPHQIKCSAL